MARKRMIDPNIWQSEDFAKLSSLAKLLFIGMFSMADDYGKGRAKPVYLKSIIFPYDDGMRLIDVEKALSEIGSNMSVTFYAHNGNDYYKLDNWDKWQKVEKPSESRIPDPPNDDFKSETTFGDNSPNVPRTVGDDSRLKEEKRKEENTKRKNAVCVPPTLEEVEMYCNEKSYEVDAKSFIDFFTESGWIDSKGNPVLNWKQKIITWAGGRKKPDNFSSDNMQAGQKKQVETIY